MTAPPESLAAAIADRYTLERELGAGGMATVYLAHDRKHDRRVAIKVLREDLSASLGKERFLREIRIAAALQHPHVLPLYDSGEAAGLLYYVMPFVDGQSLRQKLLREGELPVADAVRILRDVADALAEAHRSGVVHRDLKPENVMLRGRHALVTDFGVAKAVSEATGRQQLTTMGVALGTPAYMAPEQATADPNTDHRADIYAFGVLAYELLTGRPPFTGGTPQQVLASHVTAAATPVSHHRATLPPALAALVMQCLEKKPADRPQSAEGLIPQLEAVLTPSGGLTPAATRPFTAVAVPRLREGTWGAVAAGVVLVAVAVSLWFLVASREGAPDGDVSLAVLALDTSGDTTQAYLAQGLSERISDALTGVAGLRMKAWSASRRAQAAHGGDLTAIGAALGVRYLLEGSLRRDGGQLQLQLRLVDPATEETPWALPLARDSSAVPTIAGEVAGEVAAFLVRSLSDSARTSIGRAVTTNATAYNAYLRGNYDFAVRTRESTVRALAAYQLAAAADPSFAEAKARIAMAYGMLNDYWWLPAGMTARETLRRAFAYADSAVAGDPNSADGLLAQCYVRLIEYWYFGGTRLAEAQRLCDRAVALDPTSAEAVFRAGHVQLSRDNPDSARIRYLQATAMDPQWHVPYMARGWAAYAHGDVREACALLDSASAREPTYLWARQMRGQCRLNMGDTTTTRAEIEGLLALGDTVGAACVEGLLAAHRGDRRTSAVHAMRIQRLTTDWTCALHMEARAGNRDAALRMLETASWVYLVNLRFPELDPLRDDPRFKAIFERELRRARGGA